MELLYVLAAALIIALPFLLTKLLSGRSREPQKALGGEPVRAAAAAPKPRSSMQDDVARLLSQGGKMEAIKLMRDKTGLGLKEAKEAVEAIGRDKAIVPPAPGLAATIQRAQQMSEEVRRLASAGQKIEAIKLLREKSGIGLREAKDLVDRLG